MLFLIYDIFILGFIIFIILELIAKFHKSSLKDHIASSELFLAKKLSSISHNSMTAILFSFKH